MKKASLKYLLALLLFGSNGIVASCIALTSYEIVLLRTCIGSLFLAVLFVSTRQRLTFFHHRRQSAFLALSGVAMGASWMFLYEAYQQIGVNIASLSYYCGPVIVMALSPLLFRKVLTIQKLLGFATVLFGLFLVNVQLTGQGGNGWGLICGGMSAVMYSLMIIFHKKAPAISGLKNAMLQLLVSFLTVACFVGFPRGFALLILPAGWLPILILGLVNTGIGCYLYFSSIGLQPVQTVAICGYLEPLSAVILSVLFLHEPLLPIRMLGAALILGGAAFGTDLPKST